MIGTRLRMAVWGALMLLVLSVAGCLNQKQHQQQLAHKRVHQQQLMLHLLEDRLNQVKSQKDPDWQSVIKLSRYLKEQSPLDFDEYLALFLVTQPKGPNQQQLHDLIKQHRTPVKYASRASLPLDKDWQHRIQELEELQMALITKVNEQNKLIQSQSLTISQLTNQQSQQQAQLELWQQEQQLQQHEVSMSPLYVRTFPENAKIEVLNITPRFVQGIALPTGKYLVQVSATGYNTSNRWIELAPLQNRFCIGLSPNTALQGPTPSQHQSAIFETTCAID
ncbi:hypothetical protein [Ferrimonas aestuarii]|uniref:PEGA domain-containing protein n=1 Tax=Ferrimonas aestuarii TaxID=2569539 RepID=A0A4U1BKJ9_9GAMM|nr:hypothetical protein [Ferrimonas aestuarii]TKB53015.1 hypothetical protein FCL42_15135 [Ferrimonas aestuarii]